MLYQLLSSPKLHIYMAKAISNVGEYSLQSTKYTLDIFEIRNRADLADVYTCDGLIGYILLNILY